MVAPPTMPGDSSNPHPQMTSNPTHARDSPSAGYMTLGSLSSPSLARAFPLRVEMMEGYMSNHISQITFSASDMFNVHLLKQQEVQSTPRFLVALSLLKINVNLITVCIAELHV